MEKYSAFVKSIRESLTEGWEEGNDGALMHESIFQSLAGEEMGYIASTEFLAKLRLLQPVIEQTIAIGEETTNSYFQILLEQIDISLNDKIGKRELHNFLFPPTETRELGIVLTLTRQVSPLFPPTLWCRFKNPSSLCSRC